MNPAQENRATVYARNKKILLCVVLPASFGIASILVYFVLETFFFGIEPGPSFIETLQDGRISSHDVKAVQVLKRDLTWWPFTKSDYLQMPRTNITNELAIEELLRILKSESSEGHTYRNHPGTVYGDIFEINLNDGRLFFLFCTLRCDDTGYFADLMANSANSTNPNGSTPYENVALVKWLQKYDPLFKSIDSVPVKDN